MSMIDFSDQKSFNKLYGIKEIQTNVKIVEDTKSKQTSTTFI
jgi:hypothetical protein